MVIDPNQIVLVEPEVKRIGWGIVKFADLLEVAFYFLKINLTCKFKTIFYLKNVEVSPDKEDSRSLHIKVQCQNILNDQLDIMINAKFTFDDHIRCMAAKQHLIRARERWFEIL